MRKYLTGLDDVTSVEVDVDASLFEDDRWNVEVTLKNDPPLDSVLAIVRGARNKVMSLADTDEVSLDVRWDQGATSMHCVLPMNDPEKAVSAAVGVVSPSMESVGISEQRISLDYHSVKTLPDDFILPPKSPVVSVGSLKTEQRVLVGASYCFVTYSKGVDLTSVPLKRVVDAIPENRRTDAVVNLDAEDTINHVVQLSVRGLGEYGKGVDVDAAASVLAAGLGNQALQRVELSTALNDDYDAESVAFEMKSGAVVGQGDPPDPGAKILAAAQQAAASSS